MNDNLTNYVLKPLVSVIVATYRRDISLEKALISIVNQTYEFIEIIVVDDNADEFWNKKVEGIISNIKLKYGRGIVYLRNKVNRGSAETRNNGIMAATGRYVSFLDDDDIYLENKIKNHLEHIIEKESDFSITDLYLYDEKDRLIEMRKRSYIKNTTYNDLLKYNLMYHMTGTDTMMFRRDFLINIGGFPPIDVGDEFYLMQRAIESQGQFSYLPICDVKAYIHTATHGLSSGKGKIDGENKLYDYKKQFFSKLNNKEIRYIKMRHFAVFAFADLRKKNFIGFIKNCVFSFINSPFQSVGLLLNRK